ncbi:unnamed protein product, partial [Rotaria sordida]
MTFNHEHFRLLLASNNISVRSNAAFQMIILIHLFPDIIASEWISQTLITLFRIIADPYIDDEEKILPTDIIGRLARIPT